MKRVALVWVFGATVLACGPEDAIDRWDPVAPNIDLRDAGPESGLPAGDALEDLEAEGGTDGADPVGGEDGGPPAVVDAVAAEPAVEVGVVLDVPREGPPDITAQDGPSPPDRPDGDVELGCTWQTCRRVFVTSTPVPNGGFGGLPTADATCQRLAAAAGLAGGWWAWLSDTNAAPVDRFKQSTLPYRLLDGTRVAASWSALVSGSLSHSIDVFEDGRVLPPGQTLEVWTGTSLSGTGVASNCGNWTNPSAGPPLGVVGLTSRTDRGWSQAYPQFCNRADVHLYCFEQ